MELGASDFVVTREGFEESWKMKLDLIIVGLGPF